MGVGAKPSVSGGVISPGIDFSLSAASVNKIINSFNGFGSMNLGKVTPNFYADLKFLEDAGKIILRSTPRLSTLNGHKAVLKSGGGEILQGEPGQHHWDTKPASIGIIPVENVRGQLYTGNHALRKPRQCHHPSDQSRPGRIYRAREQRRGCASGG